jgi:hypothetical protein
MLSEEHTHTLVIVFSLVQLSAAVERAALNTHGMTQHAIEPIVSSAS